MSSFFDQLNVMVAQVTTQPNATNTTAEGAANAATESSPWGTLMIYMPIMLAVMFLYMMMTQKPQQKDKQRVEKLISALKKNDRVVTAGGIVGTVVNINSDQEFLTIRIDESTNAKMQVLKQSVVRILSESTSSSNET